MALPSAWPQTPMCVSFTWAWAAVVSDAASVTSSITSAVSAGYLKGLGMGRPSFKPAELTLPQMLRERAQSTPDEIAIRQKDFGIWNPYSWTTYWQRACHVGLGMHALGLAEGGHVGIISENRLEWVLAQMASGAIGAVAVGVYPTSPAAEASYVLAHADVELVFCEDQEQAEKVLESLDGLPALKHIVVMETKGFRNYPDAMRGRIHSFAELEALGRERMPAEAGIIDDTLNRQTLDDIGLMIYTSGSTGKPKGAMITYRNMRAVVPGIVDRLELDRKSTRLNSSHVRISYAVFCLKKKTRRA